MTPDEYKHHRWNYTQLTAAAEMQAMYADSERERDIWNDIALHLLDCADALDRHIRRGRATLAVCPPVQSVMSQSEWCHNTGKRRATDAMSDNPTRRASHTLIRVKKGETLADALRAHMILREIARLQDVVKTDPRDPDVRARQSVMVRVPARQERLDAGWGPRGLVRVKNAAWKLIGNLKP